MKVRCCAHSSCTVYTTNPSGLCNGHEPHAAGIDAAVLLRIRVVYRMETPTLGDCILLNAALHIEGRHNEVPARLGEEATR